MKAHQTDSYPKNWKAQTLAIFLILLLGAGLRFLGIGFGYPMQLHGDEPTIVNAAIKMAETNTLIAPGYERPDNIVKKASAVLYKLFSRLVYASPLDRSNDTAYFLVSRFYVAFIGVLTIYIAYLIGRRFSREAGILAALFIAVEPYHVQHSHYITSDVSVALNMCLCVLFALRYEEKPDYRRLVPMAFFAALGTLDKYPGILTCGMLGLMVILCQRKDFRQLIKHAAVLLVLYIAFLVVISPNLFWDLRAVWERIQIENRPAHLGADGLGFGGNLLYYARAFFSGWNDGEIFLATFLTAGCIHLLFVRERRNIVFSVLPIWWVFLSTRALHWTRWGVPMYVGGLLICALGVGSAIRLIKLSSLRYVVLAIVACLFLYYPLAKSISSDAQLCAVDTRQIAHERVLALGIDEQNSLYDDTTALYLHGWDAISWTNGTNLEDGQLVVNTLGKKYIVGSTRQSDLLKAEPQRNPEKLAEYLWLEENRNPFEAIKPILKINGTSKIPLVVAFRNLMAALLDGRKSYVTGIDQRFYDISDFPIRLEIKQNELKAGENGSLILLKAGISARQYSVRIRKPDDTPFVFEILDQDTGEIVALSMLTGQEEYTFSVLKDYDNVTLTLRAPGGMVRFDAVDIWSN